MDPLDPSVLDATTDSAAPLLDANLVKSVTQDEHDPAWSSVEFADGRVENRPTADALAMPKMPEPALAPTPAPVGPGSPPAVGNGGFTLTPEQQAATAATPENTLAFGGAGGSPAPPVAPPAFGQLRATPGAPGQLPPPQPGDPGAAPLAGAPPEVGTTPYSETESTGRSESEFAVDPTQLAQDNAQGFEDLATGVDQRERYNASVATESHAVANDKAQKDLRRTEIFTEESRKALKAVEDTPIEEDFYKGAPGRQVAAWVALALSGFLQGATKGANPALNQMMQSLTAAQDRFMANQRADKTSKLQIRREALGDAKAAESSMRMQLPNVIERYAQQHAAKIGQQEIPPGISTAVASMRVKGMEHQQAFAQHAIAQTDRRMSEESRAAPTAPRTQGDAELQQMLGPDYDKKHQDALDPKGANLGGMIQGAKRLASIQAELEAIAKRHGGDLPHQNAVSYDSMGASKLATRLGSSDAADQVRGRQLVEEAKLAFKQTLNIKSVDSENEGKNFNAMIDTGTTQQTLQALRDKAQETNQRAIVTASGYSRDPQRYLQFIDRSVSSNPGVSGAAPSRAAPGGIRERVVRPAPQAAEATGGGPAPSSPLAQPPSASAPGSPTVQENDPVKLQTLRALKSEAQAAGLDGDALTKIVRFESGGRADAKNASGATGLIQWMPEVFKGMTKPAGYENVRHEDLKDLTAEEQIPLVLQYFKDKGLKPGADVGEMYLAVAAPALVNQPDSKVAYKKGSAAWEQNAQWRPADGGDITAGSIRARARRF